jgi:Flp pilus assembly protein TadD
MNIQQGEKRRWRRGLLGTAIAGALMVVAGCQTEPSAEPEPVTMIRPIVLKAPTPEQQLNLEDANTAASNGDYDAAVELFEDLLDENPSLTLAYLGLGQVLVDMGELGRAEPAFARASRLEPGNYEAQFGHGEVLQMLGRLVEAIRAYQRALSIKPDSTQVLVNMTTAYLELDMPRSAITSARRAVELAPGDGRTRADLGVAYQRESLFDEAIEEYVIALELLGTDPRIVGNLVECYAVSGRFQEAVNAGQVLVRVNPTPETWERLGRAYFRTGDYAASLEAYRSSVELDPEYWAALNGIGVNELNRWLIGERKDSKSRTAAAAALRASLRANPEQPKVIRLLTTYGL